MYIAPVQCADERGETDRWPAPTACLSVEDEVANSSAYYSTVVNHFEAELVYIQYVYDYSIEYSMCVPLVVKRNRSMSFYDVITLSVIRAHLV
jgi:hypothetical protein